MEVEEDAIGRAKNVAKTALIVVHLLNRVKHNHDKILILLIPR